MTEVNEDKYAAVIIDISHEKVDRPFHYRIPGELAGVIRVGTCVQIPFGRGNSSRTGYVIETTDICDISPDKIKDITGVIDNAEGVDATRIRLASWMSQRYGSTAIAALKTVLPVRRPIKSPVKKTIVSLISPREYPLLIEKYEKRNQKARIRLIKYLMDGNTSVTYEAAREDFGLTDSVIRGLQKDNVIDIVSESIYRDPFGEPGEDKRPELTTAQRAVAEGILSKFDVFKAAKESSHPPISLIHGITGSGKTEVYMEIISGMQSRGYQSILLIPEISLTYQNVSRFRARFRDRVSVLHSKLSQGERYDQWERIRRGEVDIVIGPRSALFAPFNRIGVIIIDEEHETSYKGEQMPRYHAREVAAQMCSLTGTALVLGSATPSMEVYNSAMEGRIDYYRLDSRPTGGSLPSVSVVDMKEELRQGNATIFSKTLLGALEDRLSKGQQSMLFLNRRGYLGFVSCKSCGYVVKCPHCDVSMTQHRNNTLVCHYCGHTIPMLYRCPECGSEHVSGFKSGTQQVEEQLSDLLPGARLLRLDADTTRKKGSTDNILSAFGRGDADILIGTQMIVKGHDFPKVSLVGILCADLSMYVPDFRAGERTFQLLTQAAGRAGRGDVGGEVIIQTYQPDHYAVQCARTHDYESFFRQELDYRKLLNYPPSGHIMEVMSVSADEESVNTLCERLCNMCRSHMQTGGFSVVGPARAGIYKLEDRYRMLFYIKAQNISTITGVMKGLENYLNKNNQSNTYVFFDVDPM